MRCENSTLYTVASNTIYVDTVNIRHQYLSISNAFNAIYVKEVDTKHIHTFLPITLLIFNQFSTRKKFWKAETKDFSTIPSLLYMSILLIQDKDL